MKLIYEGLEADARKNSNWMIVRIYECRTRTVTDTGIPLFITTLSPDDHRRLKKDFDYPSSPQFVLGGPVSDALDMAEAERKGRISAEERLARIREALTGETWSQAIGRWRRDTFGTGTPERSWQRALEEFQELASELNGSHGALGTIREDVDWSRVAKEGADFCIAFAAFLADVGQDLAREIAEKHRINSTERTWKSNGDGTGYHVKPAVTISVNIDPFLDTLGTVLETVQCNTPEGTVMMVPKQTLPFSKTEMLDSLTGHGSSFSITEIDQDD